MSAITAPPNSMEAEASVLGAIFLNPSVLPDAVEAIGQDPDAFYFPAHGSIWSAIMELSSARQPIDAVTVMDQLQKSGKLEEAGGIGYLAELTNTVPTSANIAYYAKVVRDKADLRALMATCTNLRDRAARGEEDAQELLDASRVAIMRLGQSVGHAETISVADSIEGAIDLIQASLHAVNGITGMATGIPWIDQLTGGLHAGELVIIGARPSVGKTAMGLQMASHLCEAGRSGVIFSYEMASDRVTRRLIYSHGRINAKNLTSGFLGKSEIAKLPEAAAAIRSFKLHIADERACRPSQVRAIAQRHQQRHGLDFIVVDHFHLMQPDRQCKGNRVQEYEEMSRALKLLAGELRIPVILLCQLSRGDKTGGDARLSDMRGSGSLEQDADVVLLLSACKDLPPKDAEKFKDDEVLVRLAKSRDGETGVQVMRFDKPYQRFVMPGEAVVDSFEETERRAKEQFIDEFDDSVPFDLGD